MKKIIAFAVGTVAVLATAVGVQVFGTSSNEEDKGPPAVSQNTASPTPANGSTDGPNDGATKDDDGERGGYTEDHAGKPGENK